jgi:hypothetical protein
MSSYIIVANTAGHTACVESRTGLPKKKQPLHYRRSMAHDKAVSSEYFSDLELGLIVS